MPEIATSSTRMMTSSRLFRQNSISRDNMAAPDLLCFVFQQSSDFN